MNPRIRILAILPGIVPSTTILIIEPLMHLLDLGKIELRVRLEHLDASFSDLKWADLVIFCRNTEPARDFVARLLSLSKPYIYELDDNFFELPLNTPEGLYHRAPERMAQLEKYIKHARLVRVYSLLLESRVRQYTPSVKLVRPPVDLFCIPSVPPKRSSQTLKIVFSTSRTAFDNLSQIFVGDITRILHEHPDDVEVHFWGYMPRELKGLPSVKFRRFMSNYQKYMQKMYKEGYDIGLAPMKNDTFHNSKTNNKFREYGACWIAGVYSNAEVYASCVEDGRTGLLVSNEEGAWYSALNRLINNSVLRQCIQRETRAFVEKEYALDTFTLSLLNDINQVLSAAPKQPTSEDGYHQNSVLTKNSSGKASLFSRIVNMLVAFPQKVLKLIRTNGLKLTCQLILEQIERYVRYFELRWKIRQKQIRMK